MILNVIVIFYSNSIGNQTEIENSHSFIYSITKLLVSLVQQCTLSTLLANYSGDLMFTSYKIIMDDYLSFDIKCNCGVLLVIAVIHIPNQAMTEFVSIYISIYFPTNYII